MEVAYSSASASAQIDHVHRSARRLLDGYHLIHLVGQRHLWRETVESETDLANITSISIRLDRLKRTTGSAVEIGLGVQIGGKDAVLGSHLHCEIAEHQAVFQIERV